MYSDNFDPARGQKYSNNQDCVIRQSEPFPLHVRWFSVEYRGNPYTAGSSRNCQPDQDNLKVNGAAYCGDNPSYGPQGVTPTAGSELIWHTDRSGGRGGFKICASWGWRGI